jgi:LemA protein
MVVAEAYPDLKANQGFLDLQKQLEGTENRIAVERRVFNEATQRYNSSVRSFPTSIVAGFKGMTTKAYFQADAEAAKVPQVKF